MVEVSRKTAARTAAARSAVTSALKVWAGRPFFIRIGVSQASSAPAASSAAITSGQTRGSRSSTLVSSSTQVVRPSARRPPDSPTSSRSTLACPSGSRPPAPTPIGAVVIAGCGPHAVASVVEQRGARSACTAPSPGRRPGRRTTGRRAAARRPPAAGPGSVPCAPATVPEPTATGLTTTSARRRGGRSRRRPRPRRRSRRARRPRGSAPRRAGRAVHRALGDGEPLEDAQREVAHRLVERSASSRSARMSRQVRWWTESATSTWHAGGGEAVAGDRLDPQRDRLGGDRVDRGLHAPRPARRRRPARRAACRRSRPTTRRPRRSSSRRSGARPARRTPRRRSRCRC